MKWKIPPRIKVYEALGCIGDNRIELEGKNKAKAFSSSRGKFYSIESDEDKKEIMANDNGSYWQNYLGYPSIAFLMLKRLVEHNPKIAEALKRIKWKDFNVKFKNDYEKTEEYVKDLLEKEGIFKEEVEREAEKILEQIKELDLDMLGEKLCLLRVINLNLPR